MFFLINAHNKVDKVLLTTSVYRSDWGCQVVKKQSLVPSLDHNVFQKKLRNLVSLSETWCLYQKQSCFAFPYRNHLSLNIWYVYLGIRKHVSWLSLNFSLAYIMYEENQNRITSLHKPAKLWILRQDFM